MRNSKTHSKTLKRKLDKCKNVFQAYNDIQFKYGILLNDKKDVLEFECNIKIDCTLGDSYTTDFYITKVDGSIQVRECVYKNRLNKPLMGKMLDASRNYWLAKGVKDWGIVINEEK